MADLIDALGGSRTVEFAGRSWSVRPLTFNDLCEIEDRYGDVAALDLGKVRTQRFIIWLALRHSDGGTSEEQVGDMLTINDPEAVGGFINQILSASGLVRTPGDEGGDDSKNAPAPKGKRATGATSSAS